MIEPRRAVSLLGPASHGGRRALANSFGATGLLDFSTCVSAYGPADVVRAAIANCPIDEYPDPCSLAPRHAASRAWGVDIDRLAFGSGAAELIQATAHAYLEPADRVLIDVPAFGEYARSAQIQGSEIVTASIDDADHFLALIEAARPKLVFVCSPSSPLGRGLRCGVLARVADACRAIGALCVLDTSYDAFSASPLGSIAFANDDEVLTLRSLTKEHAIPGIRAGFAVGAPDVVRAIDSVRVPWSASATAQAAAVACFSMEASAHAGRAIGDLRRAAAQLATDVAALGFDVSPSETHYFATRVRSAADAARLLRERAEILVRDCTSFGMRDRIRVAARRPGENTRLLDALRRYTAELLP